jgi:DNA-binding transcriptional MocR family regulator
MTNWLPDLTDRSGPRYLAIAEALSEDISAGRLADGDRLPTHRDLGWRLGVTVGTVTRAYGEAERRGLIQGEVGRGTYVRGPRPSETHLVLAEEAWTPGAIDLSFSFPPNAGEAAFLGPTLEALARDPESALLLDYQPHAGLHRHRAAGARWLAESGLEVDPDQVVLTGGAHQGIMVCLAALTRPGDRILTEPQTYPGLQVIARTLGVRLDALASDQEGVTPEAFDSACRQSDVKALYCIPTLHNPTTKTLSEDRRRALAQVAQRHDVAIIEDDVFGRLAETPPIPITRFAPDHGYFVTSLSKAVAPGLRAGFVAGPARASERLTAAVRATCWMATPLTAAIAQRWIDDGTAERILGLRRREAAQRRALALDILGASNLDCLPGSLHLWLRLPTPWRAAGFALEAQRRGVAITPADAFTIGHGTPAAAARICLGSAKTREALERGLRILRDLMASGPSEAFSPFV